jgi:hypothetical protein
VDAVWGAEICDFFFTDNRKVMLSHEIEIFVVFLSPTGQMYLRMGHIASFLVLSNQSSVINFVILHYVSCMEKKNLLEKMIVA